MRTYWFYEDLESMGKTRRLRKPKEIHKFKNESEAYKYLSTKPTSWCFTHIPQRKEK
jgi:hypothetical protein